MSRMSLNFNRSIAKFMGLHLSACRPWIDETDAIHVARTRDGQKSGTELAPGDRCTIRAYRCQEVQPLRVTADRILSRRCQAVAITPHKCPFPCQLASVLSRLGAPRGHKTES